MADYPSDAPLPQFKITRVQGCPMFTSSNPLVPAPSVVLKVEGELINYQSMIEWFDVNGYSCSQIKFFSGGWISILVDSSGLIIPTFPNYEWHFGKWVTRQFSYVNGIGQEYSWAFSSPVDLGYSIYIPYPDELPVGVWTDLQFKQGNGSSMSSLLSVGIILGLMGLGYYLFRKK